MQVLRGWAHPSILKTVGALQVVTKASSHHNLGTVRVRTEEIRSRFDRF